MTSATVSLPADLAPALRDSVVQLVQQVGLASSHPDPREGGGSDHRCWACQERGGKLTGHHEGRRVLWIHPKCHRRLRRRRDATGRQVR